MVAFSTAIANFGAKTMREAEQIMHASVAEVGKRVIERTPIKSGKAKSNWNVQAGAPDITTREVTGQRFLHGIGDLSPTGLLALTVYVSNSLPYAYKLETGSSRQAPSGMAGITAVEWPAIVAEKAAKIRSQNYIASAVPYAGTPR